MSLRADVGAGMLFQKPRWMGRVAGRGRGGCWEVLSQCSGIRVRERTPGLSLPAEISCCPGGSERVYCPAAAPIRGVCNLRDAKGFPFAPQLLFPRNTAICQFSVQLCTFIPQGCWGRVLHPSIQNAIILPALHSQFWNTAMAVALDFS